MFFVTFVLSLAPGNGRPPGACMNVCVTHRHELALSIDADTSESVRRPGPPPHRLATIDDQGNSVLKMSRAIKLMTLEAHSILI